MWKFWGNVFAKILNPGPGSVFLRSARFSMVLANPPQCYKKSRLDQRHNGVSTRPWRDHLSTNFRAVGAGLPCAGHALPYLPWHYPVMSLPGFARPCPASCLFLVMPLVSHRSDMTPWGHRLTTLKGCCWAASWHSSVLVVALPNDKKGLQRTFIKPGKRDKNDSLGNAFLILVLLLTRTWIFTLFRIPVLPVSLNLPWDWLSLISWLPNS